MITHPLLACGGKRDNRRLNVAPGPRGPKQTNHLLKTSESVTLVQKSLFYVCDSSSSTAAAPLPLIATPLAGDTREPHFLSVS